MKKVTLRTLVSLFVITMISTASLQAQCLVDESTGKYITTDGSPCVNTIVSAVPFLRIVADARSGAMGDVGIAIAPDPNSIHFNPSNLVFAEKDLAIAATYTPWLRALGLQDVYLAYLTGYKKLSDLETIGFGLRYFSLGSIAFRDLNGEDLGTGKPSEFEVTAAYARKLTDKFSASLSGKFIYSNLAAGQVVDGVVIDPGIAGAADIGFTYKSPVQIGGKESDLTLGLAITNIGSKITYTNSLNKDFLPANLGIGGAWTFDLDDYNTLTIAADINKALVPTPRVQDDPEYDPDGDGIPEFKEQSPISAAFSSFGDAPGGFSEEVNELMYSVGAEYWYDQQFAVRAGYYMEHPTKGGRRYLTAGLGLKYNVFGLNLSYLVPTTNQRNPLDNTLRFSLLFDFGAFNAAG